MLWLRSTIFLIILLKGHGEEEYCSADNTRACEGRSKRNIYEKVSNERFQRYIRSIEHAQENYVACDNKNCICYEDVIRKSLKPFGTRGINERLINEAKTRGTYYQIIDGKLYREKDCMFPSRCAGVEHFILKVISNLTNMELIINTRDYPQSSKHFGEPLPVFSFSKTPQYYDIMYPAWAFWEGGPAISLYPRGLGRWDQHRQLLRKTSEKVAWDDKESKGFFRGSRTSPERDNLVLLSRSKPHLVDAQYTKNQGWKSPEDTLHAAPAPEVSLESHCKYKYLFNYRGVAASFRHKHLFLCRSLVFHVGNEWTEFYYDAMKPWVHYIPLSKEATKNDIEELIEFAKENDDLARGIANRGAEFIWSKLRMSDVVCFWRHLLQSYAKLLTYMPVLQPDLIRIERK